MSDQSHTPGPWEVEDPMDHCLTIVANADAPVYDWKWIATCSWPDEDDHDITSAEVKANARLIAAAPDLLEALEGLLRDVVGNDRTRCLKAWAAIAKATGEDQ